MITANLFGGLGNQLFELAALDTISKQTNRQIYLESHTTIKTHHSSENYYDTIFSNWKSIPVTDIPTKIIHELYYGFKEWDFIDESVKLHGHFQDYRYISPTFEQSLVFPNSPIIDGAFIHIRGGDYVNHPHHDLGLRSYYERAIALFPKGTKFYIFTNDRAYAKTFTFLDTIDHEFIEETNEVNCIALMKNCSIGGICPNSTFSWWGAFLNRNNRILVLPSKWDNTHNNVSGYFFPGSIVCEVTDPM